MRPSLVFLPGFMCDRRLFQPQADALGLERSIITHVTANRTIGEMAEAVLQSSPPRFALAGLSMGGIVALDIIARAPERVERLALMDTTPLADAADNYKVRTRQIADVHAGRLDDIMRDELKPAYLAPGPRKSAVLDLCMKMARDLGPDVFEAQSLALRDRGGLEHVLPTIDVPTLVLCGAQDRLCPPDRHVQMHQAIPNSTLVQIEGAGHLPTLEQPEQTIAALKHWIGDKT